jgi:hypothetical protein
MLRSLALCLAMASLLAGCASDPPAHDPWSVDFADTGGAARAVMAVSPSGDVALAGLFSGGLVLGGTFMSVGPQDNNVFTGLLDANGRPAWSSATGSPGGQGAYGVAFGPDGSVLAIGGFTNTVNFGTGVLTAVSDDIFLVKLAPGGHTTWVQQFGADLGGPTGVGTGTPSSVAVDAKGNVAMGGTFTGTIGFGGPPLDAPPLASQTSFVAEVDSAGQFVYSLSFEGLSHSVSAVVFDASGDLLVAGTNQDTLTVGGTTFSTTGGAGFLAKLDPAGNPLWAFQLGGTGTSQTLAVAVSGAGDILLGGTFTDGLIAGGLVIQATTGQDGFVLGVSAGGTPRWIKGLGGAQVSALAFGAGGTALVAGAYEGAPDFGGGTLPALVPAGAFAAKLDTEGAYLDALSFGQPEAQSVGSGIGAAGGDVVVGGYFNGQLAIGGTSFSSAAGGDVFVSRLSL